MNNNYDNENNNQEQEKNTNEPIVVKTVSNNENLYSKLNQNQTQPQNNQIPNYNYGIEYTRKAKKRGNGGLIAIMICCCIVFSSLFGVGGGFIVYNYMSNNENTPTNGVSNSGESVIKQSVTSLENLGTDTNDAIVNATAFAKDTVVEITTETVQTNMFYGQYVTEGAGSGVIITEDGYIITCAHVVTGASSVTVTMTNGLKYDAKVIGEDSQTDIAVLKITADEIFPSAVVGNSDGLVLGEPAIAIGNPLGTLGGSVSNGIISALDREITIDGQSYKLLQTNAAINPGNSGGGLFNVSGELIGVVNAKSSGNTIEGLGFAIPINYAISIAEELMSNGYISGRPVLGINVFNYNANSSYMDIRNSQFASILNYLDEFGPYFLEYSGNQTGDLQFGDRIIAIDGTPVSALADVKALLQDSYKVGDEVELTVVRKTIEGRNVTSKLEYVKLTLVESAPETPTAEPEPRG
jgi:Trypsin-like serine proteases, typically periplasmic, contain C-terminal PDZ domain